MSAKPKRKDYSIEPFRCLRCGRCCMGEGFVMIMEEDSQEMARFLGISHSEFLERYAIRIDDEVHWLKDGEGEGRPCVFLDRDARGLTSCRVEPVKPRQCRDFPYKWTRSDAKDWCAGMNAPPTGQKKRKS